MQLDRQIELSGLQLDKTHIQRQFDRSASRYDDVAQMQLQITQDLMAYAPVKARSGLQILDAGCGTGYGMQALADVYPKASIVGVDIAPAMLEIAKVQCPHAQCQVGDIEQLQFQSNSFDLTWSSSAVQWCDIEQAAKELLRVTKPGGQVLVSTFSNGTLQDWRALWSLANTDDRFESDKSIVNAFQQAGLIDIKFETRTYAQSFTSFKQAVNSIRDLGAGNAEQSRSRGLFGVEQYKDIKVKVEKLIALNGELKLPYFVTFVTGTKD